jgi:hypothetical protein
MADFTITRQERRVHGTGTSRQTLVLAKIENKVTGKSLDEWVRPEQLRTRASICSLIDWGYDDPAKKRRVAGDFPCKDAFITVTMNDDQTFNIDGVVHENGFQMAHDDVPREFVDEIKKKYHC